jgi:hypothetical protein
MKQHHLTIAPLPLLLPQPAGAETNAARFPPNNTVNRDLVRIAPVQISGYDLSHDLPEKHPKPKKPAGISNNAAPTSTGN